MISFRTASGRRIDLERLRGEDIEIADIARGLSNCCRFAGQVPKFYSVAQHCVLVANLVDQPLRLAALLHDGSEAYMGDLSRNLKHHPLLDGYRALERVVTDRIEHRFHIAHQTEEATRQIKAADDLIACVEQVVLREQKECAVEDITRLRNEGFVRGSDIDVFELTPRMPRWFEPMLPEEAERTFLAFYDAYRSLAYPLRGTT